MIIMKFVTSEYGMIGMYVRQSEYNDRESIRLKVKFLKLRMRGFFYGV
jgi:hypothetical protein